VYELESESAPLEQYQQAAAWAVDRRRARARRDETVSDPVDQADDAQRPEAQQQRFWWANSHTAAMPWQHRHDEQQRRDYLAAHHDARRREEAVDDAEEDWACHDLHFSQMLAIEPTSAK
jgi:hypothetical protein